MTIHSLSISRKLLSLLNFKSNLVRFYKFLGKYFQHQGNLDAAITAYSKILELEPEFIGIYAQLGELYERQGELEQAITQYARILSLDPNEKNIYCKIVPLLQQKKRQEEVKKYQQKFLGITTETESYNRANSLFKQGRLDRAMQHCRRIRHLQPNWSKIAQLLTTLEQTQREIVQEIECYLDDIFLESEPIEALFYQGNTCAIQGNLEKACLSYQQAIALKPNLVESHLNLGNILFKLCDFEKAIVSYQKVIALKPDWVEIYFKIGISLYKMGFWKGEVEQAIIYFQKTLALKPDWPEVHSYLGQALRLQKSTDKDRYHLQQAIELQKQQVKKHPLGQLGIRFLNNDFMRGFGHLAFNPDIYIKMEKLGWRSEYQTILLQHPQVSNSYLLNCWHQYFQIVSDSLTIQNLSPLAKELNYEPYYDFAPDGKLYDYSRLYILVQRQWETEKRLPLLELPQKERDRGWACLRDLGISQDSWFVSLHVREGGFHGDGKGSAGEFRNSNIESYYLAIQSILERGGWVIRMGDSTMKPLPPMENVIDYAHSSLKSDWMDIFLCAQCRFAIVTPSGPAGISTAFGVPSCGTNWIPLSFPLLSTTDILISKLLWSNDEQRYCTFKEMLNLPLLDCNNQFDYDKLNIKVIDNTPKEINNVVVEMLDRLDGKINYSFQDNFKQQKLNELTQHIIERGIFNPRLGRSFLNQHQELFDE